MVKYTRKKHRGCMLKSKKNKKYKGNLRSNSLGKLRKNNKKRKKQSNKKYTKKIKKQSNKKFRGGSLTVKVEHTQGESGWMWNAPVFYTIMLSFSDDKARTYALAGRYSDLCVKLTSINSTQEAKDFAKEWNSKKKLYDPEFNLIKKFISTVPKGININVDTRKGQIERFFKIPMVSKFFERYKNFLEEGVELEFIRDQSATVATEYGWAPVSSRAAQTELRHSGEKGPPVLSTNTSWEQEILRGSVSEALDRYDDGARSRRSSAPITNENSPEWKRLLNLTGA